MMTSGTAVLSLPNDTQILITREFTAPRQHVYRAWTTPELIRRWWGGRRGHVVSVDVDLRVGGAWRYVMTANEGFEVAFRGEYREIVPDERLVYTELYEGAPGTEPSVVRATFTEAGGRTTLALLADYGNRGIRDMVMASGMEVGMQEGMDLIDAIVAELSD